MANVIVDALRQSASQGLLQEAAPEDALPGVPGGPLAGVPPSALVGRLLLDILAAADQQPRTTRTYIFRDSNEQMFLILRVLSPWLPPPATAACHLQHVHLMLTANVTSPACTCRQPVCIAPMIAFDFD